jgi:hypothetical protein
MYALLFAEPVIDRSALRSQARDEVEGSVLIRACAAGERAAAAALLREFWPFVQAFELAIDRQVGRLQLRPLIQRFGQARIRTFFADARAAVREMREEEGSHADLWRRGAEQLGVGLREADPVPGVAALLDNASVDDPVEFFCWLAGTEYIAEELAAFLCSAPAFLSLFPERRWLWGEVHTAEHDGPSHLEIDEDLARAYHPASSPALAGTALSAQIRRCQRLFGEAARDVVERLATTATH